MCGCINFAERRSFRDLLEILGFPQSSHTGKKGEVLGFYAVVITGLCDS